MSGIGRGTFSYNTKDGGVYKGTVPLYMADGKEHEVVLMHRQDLELLTRGSIEMLFETKADMGEEMFKCMPDCWLVNQDQEEEHRLYLDRHVYFTDWQKAIWIRYESVDQADEDGEFDPPRSNGNLGDEYGC